MAGCIFFHMAIMTVSFLQFGPPQGTVNGSLSLAGLKQANSLKDLQQFFVSLCDSERLHRQVVADPNEVQKELEDTLYRDLLAAM